MNDENYDKIDRFLRNNLNSDEDYREYLEALDAVALQGPRSAPGGQSMLRCVIGEMRDQATDTGHFCLIDDWADRLEVAIASMQAESKESAK